MKIEQITEQYVGEGTAGSTIYVGMADEAHVGMHLIDRWEATSQAQYAARQADKIAVEYMDDIDVVVLEFVAGRPGFDEVHRAKGGRKHIDHDSDDPYREGGEEHFGL